ASSPVSAAISLALAAVVVSVAITRAAGLDRGANDPPSSAHDDPRIAWGITLAAVLVPLVLACASALVRKPVYVVGRYDLIAWGPYCLLAGAAFARLRAPFSTLCLTAWLATALWTVAPHL